MQNERLDKFDPNIIAKEYGLTEKQQAFADYYIFVCGLNGESAVEMAEYAIEPTPGTYKTEEEKERFKVLNARKRARELLSNTKVLNYIRDVRENMDKQLIVDKYYVIHKLKKLSETGTERTQLEATKLLGMTMSMFTETQKIEMSDSPSNIVQQAFLKRKQEENNIIEFPQKEENAK